MAEEAPEISALRFLVVEDQGFQRWAIAHTLEGLGAKQVFSAADGHGALEILRNTDPPPDIVVTDLNMPGMDGMEFIRHVGESGIAVAIVLASDLDRALVASVETMTDAYGLRLLGAIQKPITARKLAAMIQRHGGSDERRSAAPSETFPLEQIEAALARDEFVPYFQPKVELASRIVRGAEAVVRWNHPTRGLVGPKAFIGTLEAAGRMDAITTAILRKATVACAGWRAEGLAATVSVNVSQGSLADTSLAERFARIVAESGLAPEHVIVEVTETAAATHMGRILENLSRLRMYRFGVAIDDFGTGYASLEQLTRIPFSELKIDQQFVRSAPTHAPSRTVLESSLELAARLGVLATAEGVETREQAQLLRELGCPLAQGYYIAHPQTAADFVRWAAQRRAGAAQL